MNKELNMPEIKKALLCYIKVQGYTKSSLAKKCFLESSLVSLFFNEGLTMKKDIEEAVLGTILEEENLTIEELMTYIDKQQASEMYNQGILSSILSSFSNKTKTRDADRIPTFLNKLEEFWICNPDLRFGQVISILEKELNEDSFNAEDDKWFEALNRLDK